MNLNLLLGTAIVLMALGVAFIYLLIGRGGWRKPKDGMEWLGSVVSGGLIVSAALLLVTIMQVQAQGEVVQIQGRSQIEDFTLEEQAPNFAFRMIEDNAVAELDQFKGQVILVNFWATWCAPCLVEIPDLNELYLDYKDEGLVVLAISE